VPSAAASTSNLQQGSERNRALILTALGLLLLRGLLCFDRTMWLWGLNTQRFLPPALGWALWSIWAAACHARIGAPLSEWLAKLGAALRERAVARVGFSLVAALLVFVLEDRTWFIGDFLIRRQGGSITFSGSFLQAMPLEKFLFSRVPLQLSNFVPAAMFYRLIDAASAFALALAAIRIGRSIEGNTVFTALTAITITFGGHLLVATGLGKPAAISCAFVAAAASFVAPRRMSWSSLAKCGVAVALAIVFHRSGWLLLPCWIVALIQTARAQGLTRDARGVRHLAAALLPLAAMIAAARETWSILVEYDFQHHLGGQPTIGPGEWWTLSALPLRATDLLNLALLLLPSLPLLEKKTGRRRGRGGCLRSRLRGSSRCWSFVPGRASFETWTCSRPPESRSRLSPVSRSAGQHRRPNSSGGRASSRWPR